MQFLMCLRKDLESICRAGKGERGEIITVKLAVYFPLQINSCQAKKEEKEEETKRAGSEFFL